MKRPVGFTLLALVLAWTSLGGFGLAYWAATTHVRLGTRLAFGLIGLVHGGSGVWSAVGLWRVRPWALRPLLVWAIASTAACWLPYLMLPNQPSWWPAVLSTALVAGFLALLLRYVSGRLPQPT